MSAAEGIQEEEPQGAAIPAWMATFADLMCLLMCFFVLLFAFSKVEEEKFKAVAGSMKQAFGGIQYIKSNSEDAVPGMEAGVVSRTGSMTIPLDQRSQQQNQQQNPQQNQQQTQQQIKQTQAEELLKELRAQMQNEIDEESIVVERDGENVVIRFPEHVSFSSGKAQLVPTALPIIRRVMGLIGDDKEIVVAGHTDDIPIRGGRFRSNWELSAARAAAVAEHVLKEGTVDPLHMTVAGYADTRPLEPNTSRENRAKNRRVEIIVRSLDSREVTASATIGDDLVKEFTP